MLNEKQEQIIDKLQLEELDLSNVKSALSTKKTKSAATVLDRINAQDGDYKIFINEKQFTVSSKYLVTELEKAQLTKILKLEYIRLSDLLTKNEYWIEWVRSIKY